MPVRFLQKEGSAPTWRERLRVFGPAFLLSVIALIISYHFVRPAPPRHLVFATGQQGGAYYLFGTQYKALLAQEGIDAEVRPTSGSVENIRLLKNGEADVAFVQGGTGTSADAPELRSLASLYYEPVWVFVRDEAGIHRLADLKGHRVGIDEEGSGTRKMARLLLAANGIDPETATLSPLGGEAAVKALRDEQLDAAFFVISPRAAAVHDAITSPGVSLLSINRAPAYALQYRFLSVLTLPEGAMDLPADLPQHQTTLLTPAATLVVRQDFHPAMAELLLTIARRLHGDAGLFEQAGDFPSRKFLDFPIGDAAKRFFNSGPSLLQRYLPFWAADLVDRLKILLLPLITLIYPLFKVIPPTYDWRMRSRINHWYKDLQTIEQQIEARGRNAHPDSTVAELDHLESKVGRVSVPVGYADQLYTLRSHIALLRDELRQRKQTGAPQSDPTESRR